MTHNEPPRAHSQTAAEVEVTAESVVVRRPASEIAIRRAMAAVCDVLLKIAEELENARSPWDGETVDGEAVFFAINWQLANIIKTAVERAKESEISPQDYTVR